MDTLSVAVIEGTTRRLRRSMHVAKFIAEVGNTIEGVSTTLVDPQELNLPYDGNDEDAKDPKYTEITKKADAFFVVTPEYNHSFPGSLKRVLDSELQTYNHKPIAFAGVSDGRWGGVRAIEALVPAVRETGLVVLSFDVQFPRVQDIFNEQGELQDEAYIKRVKRVYTELVWMAKTLKWGRENL
jgi:NAD(P)H-dependent FMN reductase